MRREPQSGALLLLAGGAGNKQILPERFEGASWPFRATFVHNGTTWSCDPEAHILQGRKKQQAELNEGILNFFSVFADERSQLAEACDACWSYLVQPMVCELYSPPRIVRHCKRFGLKAGWPLDLVTGYDLADANTQREVRRTIDQEKPFLVCASPPCEAFCIINVGCWRRCYQSHNGFIIHCKDKRAQQPNAAKASWHR